MSEEKRTKSIKIRVTDAEMDALRERCPRGSLAPWLRDLGLGERKPRRTVPKVDPKLLRQLAGAGNLLNQIARKLNSGEWSAGDRIELLSALQRIEQHLAEVRRDAS